MLNSSNFLQPRVHDRGELTPETLVFNANLQEFARRVSSICNLATAGKLSIQDACRQIEILWEQLKASKPR